MATDPTQFAGPYRYVPGLGWVANEITVGRIVVDDQHLKDATKHPFQVTVGGVETLAAHNDSSVTLGTSTGGGLAKYSAALTPAAVAANTTAEQTFTVAGLQVGDTVLSVNRAGHQAGLGIVGFRVSATNTLAIVFANNTGAPITPASGQYLIAAVR